MTGTPGGGSPGPGGPGGTPPPAGPGAPTLPPTPTPSPDPNFSWKTPASLLGIAGLVAAIIFGVKACGPGEHGTTSDKKQTDIADSEAKRLPNLKIDRVAAYIKGGIAGSTNDGETTTKETNLWGPHIDVTFENRANGPALITKATLRFREMGMLDTCSAIGGPLASSANYDFAVPWPLPKMPYSVEKQISFKVDTDDLDRLTLTVGPRPTGGSPWYGIADVIFEHDGGKKLTVGPVAVVDTGDDENFYPNGGDWVIKSTDRKCLGRDAQLVDRILGTPGVVPSTELTSLRASLAKRLR